MNIEKGVDIDKAFEERIARLEPTLSDLSQKYSCSKASTSPGPDEIEIIERDQIKKASSAPLDQSECVVQVIWTPHFPTIFGKRRILIELGEKPI